MALDDYTLVDLRTRLTNEFGLSSSDANITSTLNEKINDALHRICRRRPNWPWLKQEFVIDVAAVQSGTIDVLQGSRVFSNASVVPTIRDIITFESSGDSPTTGFMVHTQSAPSTTVGAQWINATEVGKAYRIVSGAFQLPDDFIRSEGAPLLVGSDPDATEFRYKDPDVFRKEAHRQIPAVLNHNLYTVVRDPIDQEERKYLMVYPYLTELATIRMSYYRDIPKLVNDADIPIIPRLDRQALWLMAAWYVALWRGEETATAYGGQAEEALERMAQEFELVDDPDIEEPVQERDFILPPSGYEDFR